MQLPALPPWLRLKRLAPKQLAIVAGGVFLLGLLIFLARISATVNKRLEEGVFSSTIGIYSGPWTIRPGVPLSPEALASGLRRAGYTRQAGNPAGHFERTEATIAIHPGPASPLKQPEAIVQFEKLKDGTYRIASITREPNRKSAPEYRLDPQLITNLGGTTRERRRLLTFQNIPANLKNAILSVEDRNFFSHAGFDVPRLVKAVFVNIGSGRKAQGGSTLTMQLSRNLWLGPEKSWRRKITELFFAMTLEAKLTKEEIFEHYANQVYLGSHESYQIHGMGEAAWRYFNRDPAQLSLPQAATLAGIIQRPNYFDPIRHPDRAVERRNVVLGLMLRNGFIDQAQHDEAVRAPLGAQARMIDTGDAPYFVDLALDEVGQRVPELGSEPRSLRVYTTLDPDLQAKAVEAVRVGMERVDKAFAKEKPQMKDARPQVALVAIDPKTGEVRAAVGGRSYGESQLNRVRAKRQPGSAFKPFVYAAALETQLGKSKTVITGATMLRDEPTVFKFGDELYQPANFGQQYYGQISVRRAFLKSLNIPTVAIAEKAGYKQVVDVARRAGFKGELRATPAVALGAYEMTPLEVAGMYTVFANKGVRVEPTFLSRIVTTEEQPVYEASPKTEAALDPRIAWLVFNMMQDVMRYGTAGGVWSYGFNQQAAGKTGSSRDGWFAGFTKGLITVVWVGFDDNRDLELEGAKSALPVWAEFMKRATAGGAYAGAFENPPQGLANAEVCDATGELACGECPKSRIEYFIAGAEPKQACTAESVEAAMAEEELEIPDPKTGELMTLIRHNGEAATIRKGDTLGTAVWYRSKHSEDLIAAHPTLPPGSWVKVTNVGNGKSVVVRIDSRIPPSASYVISLNHQAAERLDFLRSGSAQVKVEPVRR
jgi:penicillin-binding protein 1B